jgi:protein-S-isoprenylcysteine O-methyltransferase Ste14
MATDSPNSRAILLRRGAFSLAAIFLFLAALMFAPAGIAWRKGWVFLLVFLGFTLLSCLYLWRTNPEIFIARSKVHAGTKSWDKVLLVPILGCFFAIFAVAGFDARYGWSSMPLGLVVLGYALFSFGYVMSDWVYAVNKFAEPSVRIQSDRGQKLVDTGPYAMVRHPLYVASFFLVVGIPLALGSYYALIPVGVGILAIVVRTALEDRVLQNELEGYREYASRVRYRLIPGVW